MAYIGSFTSVSAHVNPERSVLIEAFPAVYTTIRFLSAVYAFMHHQVILFGEGFSAITAFIRLITRMYPIVQNQLVLLSETFTASVAEVFLRSRFAFIVVILYVIFQRRSFRVALLADDALVLPNHSFRAEDVHAVKPDLMLDQIPGE